MRVLSVVNYFPPDYTGGGEISALMTARGLHHRGFDVRFLVINARMRQVLDRHYEWEGLPVHQIAFTTPRRNPWWDVFDERMYRQTLREIEHLRPDLMHIHNISGASLAPFVAARRKGVPVVATLHDAWLLCPNNMLYRQDGTMCDPAGGRGHCGACFRRYDYWGAIPQRRRVLAALTRNVCTFISPSQMLADLHVRGGYDDARFRVIVNGLWTRAPAAITHPGLRRIVETRGEWDTLIYAGGGVLIKGVETLLAALPLLVRYVERRLRVVVVGSGEASYLDALRKYAPLVQVLGLVPYDEIPALYAAGDLTLAISVVKESLSLVTLQSIQVGTPVVGSALGGIPELVHEGETGYLVPPNDPTALAEKVALHFVRAPIERRRLRQRCRAYAAQHLNYDQHLDAVSEVYREAAGRA